MKKLFAIVLCVILALSMVACGGQEDTNVTPTGNDAAQNPTDAQTPADTQEPVVTLKIGYSTNDQDPRGLAAAQFKAEVEEKTNGSVTVEIYPSGQLGGDGALIEAMALDSGTVDIIITDASNFSTYVPEMGISALPFLFSDFDAAWKFMDSEIEASVEEKLIPMNMRVLAHYCNGFRCVTTNDLTVNSPADMDNMLIRTPENPVIMATMRALGANPQPLPFNELYMALQQGSYDAQENPIPVIYNNKLYEVQNNLSITNHIYSGMCFTITESAWQKLSANQQEIVAAAAKASQEYNRELNKQMTEDFLSKLEEAGVTITNPDLAAFQEATASVKDEYAEQYGLKDALDAWLNEN